MSGNATYQARGIQSVNTGAFIATNPTRITFGYAANRKQSRSLFTAELWNGKPLKRLSNYQELPARCREVKKSLSNLPSPKNLRSSVNPKKGIRSTARSAIRERVPLRVPPPIPVMLS